MQAALLKETAMRGAYMEAEDIETIYFGGGTPSLLPVADIISLLESVHTHYPVRPGAEVTLEVNPDDITVERLSAWKDAGINRLSIGVQSFFEEDLQWMNRAHTAVEAKDTLALARHYFTNISIDLIYGSPGLTDEKWKENVRHAIAMDIPHLSCYALTVEPKTPLYKMIRAGQSPDTDPDVQSRQFLMLMDWMAAAGYEHYEISNFAKPGWRSRHNSAYWSGKKYAGIGPSAHSFNGRERQWNVANNNLYIKSVLAGEIPSEKETLTVIQQLNEYIMTSLRTVEGLDLGLVGETERKILLENSGRYTESGMMIREGNRLALTREGKLLADGIAAALFF